MLKRTFIISLLSGCAFAQPAFAQSEAGAEDGSGGDIVVTAQRRESRLQDVPQAVTAFGSETLERLAIRDTERLSRNTRSEERRVGKASVSTCSSRWSPYH